MATNVSRRSRLAMRALGQPVRERPVCGRGVLRVCVTVCVIAPRARVAAIDPDGRGSGGRMCARALAVCVTARAPARTLHLDGLWHVSSMHGAGVLVGVGTDPENQCATCQVCNGNGACTSAGLGTDRRMSASMLRRQVV